MTGLWRKLMASEMDDRVDYDDWLQLMVFVEMTGLISWLVLVNGIQDEWPSLNVAISYD
jgi:hypothetical protein